MGEFDCCKPTPALPYAEHPARLAEVDTCVGLVALIAYRGRVTLRIFAFDNWRDAILPSPVVVLAGRRDADASLASAWLNAHLGRIIAAEPAESRSLITVCARPHRHGSLAEQEAWGRAAAEIAARS